MPKHAQTLAESNGTTHRRYETSLPTHPLECHSVGHVHTVTIEPTIPAILSRNTLARV